MHVEYSNAEDLIWSDLYEKQSSSLVGKAYDTFFTGLKKLDLPRNRVPQLDEISDRLYSQTKWRVKPVEGLLNYIDYFTLLSERVFPSTVFIREHSEFDLCRDPDIFHEIFGHCTNLTDQSYANFLQEIANVVLSAPPADGPLLQRLVWFTTETGLLRSQNNIKVFGSSALSSYRECRNIFSENSTAIKKEFTLVDVFREPFRADLVQRVYFIMNDLSDLYGVTANYKQISEAISEARALGEVKALFPVELNKYININECYETEVAL